jgi:NADH dehydrogenase [ubiquinone] 1 alpha subcomplex assembly factor 5
VTDVGALLQRAGFALPTIDVDTINVTYPNAAVLMEHLQRMGENNASLQRRDRVSLDTFLATACVYGHLFGVSTDGATSGEIEASLQIIYAIGWTPHESQPKPLERGSATHKVGDLPTVEVTKTEGTATSNNPTT